MKASIICGVILPFLIDIFVKSNVVHKKVIYPKIYETNARSRRQISNGLYWEKPTVVKVIELDDLLVQISQDDDYASRYDGLKAEWISDDGKTEIKRVNRCFHGKGTVSGSEGESSKAVMTLCGHRIMGYVEVDGRNYFVEPMNATSRAHIFYSRNRRSVDDQPSDWTFNLTMDTMDLGKVPKTGNAAVEFDDYKGWRVGVNEGRNEEATNLLGDWRREIFSTEDIGYFYDSAWSVQALHHRRKHKGAATPKWLEIALAVDNTVISFHGRDKVEQYVLTLMNIVSAIYQDPSLESNMELVLTRLIFHEHKKHSPVRPGNAKKSLENVNEWNEKLHGKIRPGQPVHDVAIWLTRADIGGPSGYAPVGGACDPQRSCALNRDEGLSSSFIIAHEVAHILGLSHDGDQKVGNDCGDEAIDGSVMAPMVSATFGKFIWSECSQREFRKKSRKWSCLGNPPNGLGEIVLNASLQNAFSMDEQCRMEFGEGYELCRAFEIIEPCSHLWCGHVKTPLVCKTKKGPPLEGTECGPLRWCVKGYCEDVGEYVDRVPVVLNPQDGGWGQWSAWGPCSRSCGRGVAIRSRQCDNPPPSFGGKNCEGRTEEWKICNVESCREPIGDFRAEQCKRLPKLMHFVDKLKRNQTWLPYESENRHKKCKLICLSEGTKELFISNDNLIDGTPCSYESTDDICIQGICHFIGCNGQLNSTVKSDKCGVCGGDGSNCIEKRYHQQKNLKKTISRMVVLPRLSREIKLNINVSSKFDDPPVAFMLRNRRKKKYIISIPNIGAQGQIMEGAKFFYKKKNNNHEIWAKGPVLVEMLIMAYTPRNVIEEGLNVSIALDYTISKEALIPSSRYSWILGGWGPCSASCGGGKKQRTSACWDSHNNKLVKRKFCSLLDKPTPETQKCNTFDCNFEWVAGKWEPCSATCGGSGIQERELYCLPKSVLTAILFQNNGTIMENPWTFMMNPKKCPGITPISTRPCNRKPCIASWTVGNWSECSSSCGSGISTRTVRCPAQESDIFQTCEVDVPPQHKICTGPYSPHTNSFCRGQQKPCRGDQSKYCSLPLLLKYCNVKGFKRICCESCQSYQLLPTSF